jgi:outer membrane protein OmpA-like peptidoglycan-associated protein
MSSTHSGQSRPGGTSRRTAVPATGVQRPAPAAPARRPASPSPLERQADRTAAHALAPSVSLASVGLSPATAMDPGTARIPAREDLPLGTGRPLDPATAHSLGGALGHDFSKVRIHDDASAAAAADRIGARAFARGDAIAFGRGEYRPQDADGRRLLVHELAHVLQQRRPGAEAGLVQREEKKDGAAQAPAGPGASAPAEAFKAADGKGDEDIHILFGHDQAAVPASVEAELGRALSGHAGPVTVDIHGYASLEGTGDYNRNLSAQRAAAVKRRILPLLPPGSVVRLFARGETGTFGDLAANRRAGIDIRDGVAAAPVAPPASPAAQVELPETLPEAKQPAEASAPGGTGETLAGDRPVAPSASGTPWFNPLSTPLRLPAPMGLPLFGDIPGRLALLPPTFGPTPSPYFAPAPLPLFHAGMIDWSGTARDFSTRGLVLDQPMAGSLQQQWFFWANLLHGLGLPADQSAKGANLAMEFTAGTYLEQTAPTLGERFNQQLVNEGHSVYGPYSVDLLKVYRYMRDKMK